MYGPRPELLKLADLSLFGKLTPGGGRSSSTNIICTFLLDVRYRMHPVINSFGNAIIFGNILTPGAVEVIEITQKIKETLNRVSDASTIDRHMFRYLSFRVSPHEGKERDHRATSQSSILGA